MVKCAHSSEQLSLFFPGSADGICLASGVKTGRVPGRRHRGRARPRNSVGKGRRGNARSAERCVQCGHSVDVPKWLRQKGLSLHYCSSECRRDWLGDSPPLGVGSTFRRRSRGGNWNVQSVRARERDGFACRACGVTEEELGTRLDVHHNIPYRRFKSNIEANKLEHLISVCPSCHGQLEAQLRRELPLFGGL
jgi:5-methylcytosine-specific restriction endonuclease McrA